LRSLLIASQSVELPTRGFSVELVTDSVFESIGFKLKIRVC